MTRSPRLLAVVTGVAAAAVALTGCGDGTVRTGAAATVGGQRITTSALDDVVTRSLQSPAAKQTVGSDRVSFERTVLGRMINHLVVAKAAEQEHVTVDGATVDAVQDELTQQLQSQGTTLGDAAGKAGISPQDLRQTLTDVALRNALSDALTGDLVVPGKTLQEAYQQNIAQFDQVHSAHILVATEALAKKLLAQVKADPTQFAALAAKYSTDTSSKDKGGDLGFQGKGALAQPFEMAIFTNKPGSYVIAKTRFGFHVIHIIERKTTTVDEARTTLRRNILGQQRQAALASELSKVSKALRIDVNPRFGRWDAAVQEVIATPLCANSAISSPSARPGDAAPATSPSATPVCP